MDNMLVDYLSFLCKQHKPEKIYFIHVSKHLSVESELKEKFPELAEPRDEKLEHDMKEMVATHFPDVKNFDVEYKVIEGSPLKEILHWSQIKNIDLLLLGRKRKLTGSGVLPDNISRKINCSLFFVNESPALQLKNIFVPSDFSKNSILALKEAVAIAETYPEPKIYFHHIYQLPTGYYKTGKSEEEFAQIMRENAVKKYLKVIEENGLEKVPITPVYTFDEDQSHSELILQKALDKKADLIIVGAKGRTFTTALLLGSVTEKLLRINKEIPTLVVKVKNKNLDLLEWLKIV
ncbi:MAG: universal stress protein, partial [Chitinophagales bacterium]